MNDIPDRELVAWSRTALHRRRPTTAPPPPLPCRIVQLIRLISYRAISTVYCLPKSGPFSHSDRLTNAPTSAYLRHGCFRVDMTSLEPCSYRVFLMNSLKVLITAFIKNNKHTNVKALVKALTDSGNNSESFN